MTETDDSAVPTFPTAPWDWTKEPPRRRLLGGEAAVWDSKGDLVCAVNSDLANDGEVEDAKDRARLIAAAANVAQEVEEMGHDPVAAVEVLPKLLRILEAWHGVAKSTPPIREADCHEGTARSRSRASLDVKTKNQNN